MKEKHETDGMRTENRRPHGEPDAWRERDDNLVKLVAKSALPSPEEIALLAELRKLAD